MPDLMLLDFPALDAEQPPQIVMNGDTARARESDPATSHAAADSSSRRLVASMVNVLSLIRVRGPMVGSELNADYAERVRVGDWERIATDSPRKRAGDLAKRGLLARRPARIGLNADPETEFELTLRGLEALEMAS